MKLRLFDGWWGELLRFALILLLVVVPIRLYVAQPFIVSGASMAPTFSSGDYLIIDQLTYALEQPQRGDVVIFRFPHDPSKFFIKRIIGLPGETVRIHNGMVRIKNTEHENGFTLDEPYIEREDISEHDIALALGPDEYFVLGDNRPASSDSRFWGAVRDEAIIGRVAVRLLPADTFGLFPGVFRPGPDTTTEE